MTTVKKASPEAPFRIMIADDDADDVQLTKDCFDDSKLPISINDVGDGQLLIDHLHSVAAQQMPETLPQLILLDLNMPRKSGFEVLREMKEHSSLCRIPVVIFSTSKATKDVEHAYELGASCFVNKPNTLEEWCDQMSKLGRFWIDCVQVAV